jgi:hypothetical protein
MACSAHLESNMMCQGCHRKASDDLAQAQWSGLAGASLHLSPIPPIRHHSHGGVSTGSRQRAPSMEAVGDHRPVSCRAGAAVKPYGAAVK